MPPSPPDRRRAADTYHFHDIHPRLHVGTASDRYAGWIGQIYPEHYEAAVNTRTKRLGGQTFQERVLPVSSVTAYFDHFSVLELDFTYYRPLRDASGEASSNYHVLQQYADAAPASAQFLLKAPQQYVTPTLRRSRDGKTVYVENPDYLDAAGYTQLFLEPARELLGDRLRGVVFEQAYRRVRDTPPPDVVVQHLSGFFDLIPSDVQTHLELRSEHLLVPAYFDWLDDTGLGFVFSHWTWLPAIREQWKRCGQRFTARNRDVVTRLLTPRDVKYADAYAAAYPFDRPVQSIVQSEGGRMMVLDTTALLFQAERQDAHLLLMANNRAWGNAPELARAISHRILDEADRRAQASATR